MSAEFLSAPCMSRCCSPAVFPGHPSGVADLTCPSSSCSSPPSAPSPSPLFQPPSTRLLGHKLRTHPCPPPLLPGWQVHLSSVHLLVQLLFTFLHHHQRPRAHLPPSTLASSPAESNLCKVVRAVLFKSNSHHVALLLTAPPRGASRVASGPTGRLPWVLAPLQAHGLCCSPSLPPLLSGCSSDTQSSLATGPWQVPAPLLEASSSSTHRLHPSSPLGIAHRSSSPRSLSLPLCLKWAFLPSCASF